MVLVKMDEKGRIQLPKLVREKLHIRPRQSFRLDVRKQELILSAPKFSPSSDPLLKELTERPLKLKNVKLTKELLDKLEEEQWSQ